LQHLPAIATLPAQVRVQLSQNETGAPDRHNKGDAMDGNGTEQKVFKLPVLLEAPRERVRLAQAAASVDFLSQLIAERQRLPPQRERRRASLGVAVDAYANGGKIAVRRVPAGYRTTIVT
jgi:hypothetical protein